MTQATITLGVDGAAQSRRQIETVGDALRGMDNTSLQGLSREIRSVRDGLGALRGTVGAALGALAAAGAVGLFAGWIKGAIDATDAASDLSQKTGIAVKDLAGLELWFKKGGMEAGAFESSMVKLSNELRSGGESFERLGIKTREADGSLRSNVEVMLDSADAFAKMQDGTAKTALAVELFGKSGAQLIPMLNEGSGGLREMNEMAEKLGLTFDQKTVDAAGSFNDTLDFMGLATQGIGRQVAAQLLPTLNSLVGSMFKFATSGDGVRRAADMIGTGFKIIYTAGVSVVTLFNVVGKTIAGSLAFITNNVGTLLQALKQGIEGNYADAWRTITSGGVKASAILSSAFTDVKGDLSAAATTIGDAWTGAGGDAVAALAGIQKKSKELTDEERKRAEKAADSARNFIEGQEKELAAIGKTEAQQRLLTAARAAAAAPEAAQKARIVELAEAINAESESWELAQKARTAAAKRDDDHYAKLRAGTEAIDQRIVQMQSEIDLHGMTASAAIDAERAKLEAKLAAGPATYAELAALDTQIAKLKELANLSRRKDALDAEKKANEERVADQIRMWDSIDRTAHDTFVSIQDGGKNMWQRLKESGQNIFFDWLYQMTAKKWLININASMGLTGGLSGAAQAASTSGSLLSTGSSVLGGVANFGGSAIAGIGNLIGSSSMSAFGAGFAGNTMGMATTAAETFASMGMAAESAAASWGAMASAALPWVAGIAAAAAVLKKGFGYGPKEITRTSIDGSFVDGGGFAGNINETWKKEGGWFVSDKGDVDRKDVSAEMVAALNQTYTALKTSTADYIRTLGINADWLMNRSQNLSVTLTGDAAKDEAAIAAFFARISDDIALEFVPALTQFQKAGESTSATLQRVASDYALVDQALTSIGMAFAQVGVDSLAARERLIANSGGAQSFAANTAGFAQNFLSEDQRNAPVLAMVRKELDALGYAAVDTREEFAAAVLKLNVANEAESERYGKLIQLQGAFAQVYPWMEKTTEAVVDSAEAQRLAAEAWEREREVGNQARSLEAERLILTGNALAGLRIQRDLELENIPKVLHASKEYNWALEDQASAAQAAAAAWEREREIGNRARSLEAERLRLIGDAAGALLIERDLELETLPKVLHAAREYNWALEDQAAAAQAATAAWEREREIGNRARSLEAERLRLIGDAAGALRIERDLELETLPKVLHAAKEYNWALQDQAVASAAAKEAADQLISDWIEMRNNAAADQAKAEADRVAAAEKAAAAAQVLAERRAGMETELYNLTHTAVEQVARARQLELDVLDPTLVGLQKEIHAAQDKAKAEEAARAVASERAGLERELLQLQGNTVALRELDLAAIDPANRALKQHIWAMQDQAEAARNAAQSVAQSVDIDMIFLQMQANIITNAEKAWRSIGESLIEEVSRIRGVMQASSVKSLAEAQTAFSITSMQARAGDINAAKLLPEMSRALLEMAEQEAVTTLDLRRIQAATVASLEMTAGVANGVNFRSAAEAAAWNRPAYVAPAAVAPMQDTSALLAELKAVREELASIKESSRKHADMYEQQTEGGNAARVVIVDE